MRYAVLLYEDETAGQARTPAEREELMAEHQAFVGRVHASGGQLVAGNQLQPTATARTLRWPDDGVTVSEGPFAETAEQFGGFYTIDVADLDAAMAAVTGLPHHVELRPVVEHPEMEASAAASDDPLYVVLLYGNEDTWLHATPDERDAMSARHGAYAAGASDHGATIVGGEELAHSSTATTLRLGGTDGEVVVSDGPFAETAEQLGGFYLVRAPSVEAVISHLDLLPGEATEVRPAFEMAVRAS